MFFLPLILHPILALLLLATSNVLASPLPRILDNPDVIPDTPKSSYVTRFSQRVNAANVKLWEYVENTKLGPQTRRLDIFAERASEEPIFISVRGVSPPSRDGSHSLQRRSLPMGAEEQKRSILEKANAMQADSKRDFESNASSDL